MKSLKSLTNNHQPARLKKICLIEFLNLLRDFLSKPMVYWLSGLKVQLSERLSLPGDLEDVIEGRPAQKARCDETVL